MSTYLDANQLTVFAYRKQTSKASLPEFDAKNNVSTLNSVRSGDAAAFDAFAQHVSFHGNRSRGFCPETMFPEGWISRGMVGVHRGANVELADSGGGSRERTSENQSYCNLISEQGRQGEEEEWKRERD